MPDTVSKSWFAVLALANPETSDYSGKPQEICEQLRDAWVGTSDTRTGAWAYCISKDGFHHAHMVLEDSKAMRFSAVKQVFGTAHIEATKGDKRQAEDYITKQGKYAESGEQVVCVIRHGEIQGKGQGHRSDLDQIHEMLEAGMRPSEIFRANFSYRRYSSLIKSAFYDLRREQTSPIREVKVHYRLGKSGSGKTYYFKRLCEIFGRDEVHLVSEYERGGFDAYLGEKIIFLDEFKGQLRFSTLLSLLDCYPTQVGARYSNVWTLWDEVYITSVIPPEQLYFSEDFNKHDKIDQLLRRISDITYCYKDIDGYYEYTIPMSEYTSYEELQNRSYEALGDPKGPQNVENEGQAPAQDSPPKKKDQLMIGDSPEDFEEITPEDDLPF